MHRRTRPYRSQTNGKAERFNRILTEEFLYNFKFRSESERRIRLKRWVHDYNRHRHHTAVGGPPASRANNLTRTDTQRELASDCDVTLVENLDTDAAQP